MKIRKDYRLNPGTVDLIERLRAKVYPRITGGVASATSVIEEAVHNLATQKNLIGGILKPQPRRRGGATRA